MRRYTVASLAAVAALVISSSLCGAQRIGFFPHVGLQLEPNDDGTALVLTATSYRAPFTMDSSRLRFTIRKDGASGAAAQTLLAKIGPPTLVVSTGRAGKPNPDNTGFTAPIVFPNPPDTGAPYDIRAMALSGIRPDRQRPVNAR